MIISEKNQKSNRQNAQHSTGPKTPEGKAAIRFNALTYGLRTRATVLESENAADYSRLWDELEADWQPQDRTERCYLETMVTSQWLLARVADSERKVYEFIEFGEKQFVMLGLCFETTRATGALLPHRHRGHEAVAKGASGPAAAAARSNGAARETRCGAGSATRLCDVGGHSGPRKAHPPTIFFRSNYLGFDCSTKAIAHRATLDPA